MLFNSIEFSIFFPTVFIVYWFFTNKNLKSQNILISAASYIFYGWWDWRFLFLIFISTCIDYIVCLKLAEQNSPASRKFLLWISITTNIGFLAFFKYFNFFIDNFGKAFSLFGTEINTRSLNIILPVGISFYTFQTLSYTIDVYRKKLEPTKDFAAFAAFVSFFPQLVAGPIERATHLLPQFYVKRYFNYLKAVDGMRQILWGFFKKVVIADNCAVFVNLIFNNSEDYSGMILLLGVIFFSFQIYCDFSGYSDIAIGVSRLFGFDLMQNFAYPYFSRNISEFWKRWHISLSTWFRDYLYIPLGGSRSSKGKIVRNIFIIFTVSGFWHGANWTFITWGVIHALFFIPLISRESKSFNSVIVAKGKLIPDFKEILQLLNTFCLVTLSWIFFRSENLNQAFQYLSYLVFGLFDKSSYVSTFNLLEWKIGYTVPILILIFILIEWFGRENRYALEELGLKWKSPFRYIFYYVIIISILYFKGTQQEFIYFQF